jgi:hypothetical protein
VKMTFGNRALAMLSGVALATVFVAGCTEETPAPSTPPSSPPAASAPAVKPGGDMKPAAPPAATPAKPEEKKP